MSQSSKTPENPGGPRPWQPRFGIGAMLLVMIVVCGMAAAGSYLARALKNDDHSAQLVFILFTLAAPMFLMVAINLIRVLSKWFEKRQK